MSYLRFEEQDNPGRKTKRWLVYATSGVYLGKIEWMSGWRKHIFGPETATVFDPSCLREIADFCQAATTAQKEA
jgi:hypothetical protein